MASAPPSPADPPIGRPLGAFPDAVLLVHGQPGSARDWSGVVHLLGLASPGTRVVAPDRPGWGRSREDPGGLYDNAEALLGVLDEAGVGAVVAVGHSWGGGVVLALAARHPERVAALVLAGSLNPTQEPGLLDVVFGYMCAGPILARLYGAVLMGFPRWRGARRILALRSARWSDEGLRRAFARSYRSWLRPDMWRAFVVEERRYRGEHRRLADDLAHIRMPALVLVGDRDEFESVAAAQALADALPAGRLGTITDAGHGIPWTRPGVFVRAVSDVAVDATSPRRHPPPEGRPPT